MNKAEFRDKTLPGAKSVLSKYGIVPIVTITQAAHESGWGNSGLTKLANNLFGYTANAHWLLSKKPVENMRTIEYSNYPPEKIRYWNIDGDIISKEPYKTGSKLIVLVPFKKYDNWEESVLDWAYNISFQSRYAEAYVLAKAGNLDEYAKAIQKAGYATDPSYANQLIALGKEIKTLWGEL
jgi:flagellum-specific peptidoglycan hydrolase FlgJ